MANVPAVLAWMSNSFNGSAKKSVGSALVIGFGGQCPFLDSERSREGADLARTLVVCLRYWGYRRHDRLQAEGVY